MKTIIAGSRDFNDYRLLLKQVDYYRLHKNDITEVVSGCAKGADELGERYANENGIPIKAFPADWNQYKKSAGPIRNREMAQYAEVLIAVWDGKSRGTKNMIDEMNKLKKPVFIIWTGEEAVAQGEPL